MLLRIHSKNSEHFLGAVEHLLATDVPCPTTGVGQLLRFGQISLTSHQSLFGPLALRQIEHECDALVTALFKCCPTYQYGHTATVFSCEFFFERLEPTAAFLPFDPCVIPVAPVGRRQVRPPYTARNQVFAIVAHRAKKFVVGLKNATVEIPDENPDDVGIDQAPDLCFACPQRFLGALALRQIEDERDALVAVLFEQRASNQHGDAAAIFSKKLLLVRLSNRIGAQFRQGALVALAPFRWGQVRPAYATR